MVGKETNTLTSQKKQEIIRNKKCEMRKQRLTKLWILFNLICRKLILLQCSSLLLLIPLAGTNKLVGTTTGRKFF